MSVGLLLPLGLSALLALGIPLLLHLHRRQQQKITVFAALRWIRGPARPRRRLRIEQWPLLLLRLALIAALALLLAEPFARGERAGGDRVVVVPGVDAAQARAQLALPEANWHWLLPDFPPLATRAPNSRDAIAVASLLRELDSELPADVTLHVIAPAVLPGLDGGSIRLSREVDWRIVAGTPTAPPAPPAPAPLRISLRTGGGDAPAAKYLKAAVAAGNADAERYRLVEEAADAPLDAQTAAVFWLAGEPSPALLRWVDGGGSALLDGADLADASVLARDARGAAVLRAQPRGRGRLLGFSAPLQPQRLPLLLDPTFAHVLLSHLQPAPPPPDRADTATLRPLTGAVRADAGLRTLSSWLLPLIALLVLAERALSFYSARRAA